MSLRTRRNARRVSGFTLLALVASVTIAHAQDFTIPSRTLAPLFALQPQQAFSEQSPGTSPDQDAWRSPSARSSRGILLPLYVSFATLQVLDVHSTSRALAAGGVEANPVMRGVAGNPAALLAVKAGVTASTIVLAEKVRSKSRVGAILLMAALNSTYATVVAHNYRVVR
jgi:hypothetical protein